MKKENKRNSDITELVDAQLVEEVVTELAETSDNQRRDKFILYWLLGKNAKQAALLAGYSQSYSKSGIQKALKNSEPLRQRIEEIAPVMPERYKTLCRLRLYDIAEVEGLALAEYKQNPKLAIDKPQLLKQMKQTAGVIGDDLPPPQQIINVEQIQAVINQTMGTAHVSQKKKEEE